MTEDEAKTKWCPFVRAIGAVSDDAAANRWPADPDGESDDSFGLDSSGQPHALCIASQCMAWRWAVRPRVAIERLAVIGTDGEFVERPKTVDAGSGYCGLAGSDAP